MQEKRDSSARSAPRNDKNLSFSASCEARSTQSSDRQWLAFGFFAKGDEGEPDDESKSHHRYRNSERLEVADSRAHEEREPGGEKAPDVGDEREGARAALRSILFRQPE